MKHTYIIWVTIFSFWASNLKAQNFQEFIEKTDEFLKTYTASGKVHYQSLSKNKATLQPLSAMITQMDVEQLSHAEQKAFYINTFNLLVIQAIAQNYPLLSPNENLTFWTEELYRVNEQSYSLGKLKAFILNKYTDNRLYFVLSDGTLSGAPITDFAYRATALNQQLDQQLISLFNQYHYFEIDDVNKEARIPLIFKQKAEQFTPSVVEFINQYSVRKIGKAYHLHYQNYDARLNDSESVTEEVIAETPAAALSFSNPQIMTLPKGKVELSTYQSIFTANQGTPQDGSRLTYYTGFYTANVGITGKFDLGVNMIVRSVREHAAFNSSPFNALALTRQNNNINYNGRSTQKLERADWQLSHIGLQVRYGIFKKLNLTFEHGLYFPIKGLPAEGNIDNSFYIVNQFYFYHKLSSKFDLFFALGFWTPVRPGEQFKFQPPLLNVFFNYYVTHRFSLYATTLYGAQWGGGFKFMIAPRFEISTLVTYVLPVPELINLFLQDGSNIMGYNMGLRYRF